MIARVVTCIQDNLDVVATIQYLDDTDPANPKEVGVQQFRFGPGTTNQQAAADVKAYGKSLGEKVVDQKRLLAVLTPGTVFSL